MAQSTPLPDNFSQRDTELEHIRRALDGTFDDAYVCVNGHVITGRASENPELYSPRCNECGAEVIRQCSKCRAWIRGKRSYRRVIDATGFEAPNNCHECGEDYPWRTSQVAAAKELLTLALHLPAEDQQELDKDLKDIAQNSPRAEPAARKWIGRLKASGKEGYEIAKSALASFLAEVLRKTLFPDSK